MKKYICFLLLMSVSILGQVKHTLKEIIVEGKQEIDALEKRKQSPFPLMVLTARQIKGFGHQTAGDVIKHLPRLYMQGPLNLQRNVKMAGLDKEFQTILINGIRPFGGADRRDIKLDRIPVNMIERIEILSNPPADLVSDAVAGVVNIILKEDVQEDKLSLDLNSGTQTIVGKLNSRGSINYNTKINNLSIAAGVSVDDYIRRVDSEIKRYSMNAVDKEQIDVTTVAANLMLKYKSGKNTLVFTPYFSNYDEFTDIKTISSINELVYEDRYDTEEKVRRLQNYSLEYNYNFSSRKQLVIKSGLSSNHEEKFKISDKKTLNSNEFKYEDEIQNASVINTQMLYRTSSDLFSLNHNLKFGSHYVFNDRSVDRIVSFQAYEGAEKIPSDESYSLKEHLLSIYIQDQFSLTKKLNIQAGLRYEYANDDYNFLTNKGSKSYNFLNPSLFVSYKLDESLISKLSVTRQISRAPYMYIVPIVKRKNKKTEMGNEDLIPSASLNFGLSLQKYFSQSDYLILTGYYKDISDIIEQVFVGFDELNNDNPIFQAVNISKAKIYGVDLEMKYSINEIINYTFITANLSWMDSQLEDPRTEEKRKLKDQPDYIINLMINYANPNNGLDLSLGINQIGERIDPESSSIDLITKPFLQLDMQIKYYINNKFNVYLTGKNITGSKVNSNQGSLSTVEDFGSIYRLGFNYRIF